jgi:hypothetical protein
MNYSETIKNYYKENSLNIGRLTAANIVKKVLPFEFNDSNNNLDRLENLKYREYGTVYCVPHFSTSDFLRTIAAFLINSEQARKGPILAPLAMQYVDNQLLEVFRKLTATHLEGIVTKTTLQHEENLLKSGKQIPWKHHELGFGTAEYVSKAVEILGNAGSVYIAPQAERQEKLYPFVKPTIGLLDANLQRHGIEHVAYAILGIDMPDCEDYSLDGLNFSQQYNISLHDVLTSEELRAEAPMIGKRSKVDTVIYSKMYQAAPIAYRP